MGRQSYIDENVHCREEGCLGYVEIRYFKSWINTTCVYRGLIVSIHVLVRRLNISVVMGGKISVLFSSTFWLSGEKNVVEMYMFFYPARIKVV